MYATENYRTKKALKEAVAAGVKVRVYQPGPFGGNEPVNGRVSLEGPWSPEPHRWWATAILRDGYVIRVS